MGDSSHDDHHCEEPMADPPYTKTQSQPAAERRQKCCDKDCQHGDHAPDGERRRRLEEKNVNYILRTSNPKEADMEHHCCDQQASDPGMQAPRPGSRRSW